MGRILAIDFGTKRVGLAVNDPLQIIASPLDTVHSKDVIQYLKELIKMRVLKKLFWVYRPNLMEKTQTLHQQVKQLHKHLQKQFPEKPVNLHDERFTSKIALDAMIASGYKKKDRREKGNIDKVSATVILQSYLESKQI